MAREQIPMRVWKGVMRQGKGREKSRPGLAKKLVSVPIYMSMDKPKFYVDTTIPNYVFNSHVPDKQEAAKKFLAFVREQGYSVYISSVVIREIQKTQDITLRNKLAQIVKDFPVLEITEECISLAEEYIKQGIIPSKNRDDALHIACATMYGMDYLVSYNFEHIVKIRTIDKVTGVNLLEGQKTPRMVIPEEVIDV